MVDRGLYNHIKNAIAQGKTKDEITGDLSKGGWNSDQINEAYGAVENGAMPEVVHPVTEQFPDVLPRARGRAGDLFSTVILVLLICAGAAYLWYYLIPTFDFDFVFFQVTVYPAFCQTVDGATSYSADSASPVTFKLDADDQQIIENVYTNYKSAFQRGASTYTHTFDDCNINDRFDWQCTEGTVTLGFTNGQFSDSALNEPNVCFVPRAQWYRLLYPPPWSAWTT